MKLEIREPKGARYTVSVGDMSILGEQYEVRYGHFWEKASYHLVNRENKVKEYSIIGKSIVDSSGELICQINENSMKRISLSFQSSCLELKLSLAEGILIEKEEWSAYLNEEEIGTLTVKSPILVHVWLDADFAGENKSYIILAAFSLWANCIYRYHE